MFSMRHIGIVTANPLESMKFYKSLGFDVVSDNREVGNFISKILGIDDVLVRTIKLSNGSFTVELLNFEEMCDTTHRSLTSLGCTHFAVNVECIESMYQKICSLNAIPVSKPLVSNDGNAAVFFAKDPNNEVYIEFVQVLK